jgi:ribonuclease-3
MNSSDQSIAELEQRLGHSFAQPHLLQTALSHASFVNEARRPTETYERLEFVGDAVLGLLCAQLLFEALPSAPEGELSRRRARVVRRETLADLANELGLAAFVRVGAGHSQDADSMGSSILADVFEAVMGALYLDGGLGAVRQAFAGRLQGAIDKTQLPQDFKTRLQEAAHSMGLGVPVYVVEDMQGPAHKREFSCAVRLQETVYGRGVGTSKKTAEQICAQSALLALGIGRDDP